MNNNYDESNVFAQIIDNQLPCRKIYEDDFVLSFYDINPQANIHALVIPKKKVINYYDFLDKSTEKDIYQFNLGIYNTIKLLGVKNFKLLFNNGSDAGQEVFHMHAHILSNDNVDLDNQ